MHRIRRRLLLICVLASLPGCFLVLDFEGITTSPSISIPEGGSAPGDAIVIQSDVACDKTLCGPSCVDLLVDPQHCGGCGQICGEGCENGACGQGRAIAIAAGYEHACVLLKAGTVWCWGNNEHGQVGQPPSASPTCENSRRCEVKPKRVPGLSEVKEIALGNRHTCALKTDGTVWCWGGNGFGTKGTGWQNLGHKPDAGGDIDCNLGRCNPIPTKVEGLSLAAHVFAGQYASCIQLASGSATSMLQCWGENSERQLAQSSPGNGGAVSTVTVASSPEFQVSLHRHVCATLSLNNRLYCWGRNNFGELGHPRGAASDEACFGEPCNRTPQAPLGDAGGLLQPTAKVATGEGATCVVKTTGEVYCFGFNGVGGLGTDAGDYDMPRPVAIPPAKAIASGAQHRTCALLVDGTLRCWGASASAMGVGKPYPESGEDICDTSRKCFRGPRMVVGEDGGGALVVEKVAVGADFTLALSSNGRVFGWGVNTYGQTGHPPKTAGDIACDNQGISDTCSITPVRVEGLPFNP